MKNTASRHSGELRIIGGRWRSRKLRFPALPGLRPTPDRVRETLFNWLAPVIDGARCLDLFAGSGALGLEALSRGAASCCFVDSNRNAIETIRQHLQTLQAEPQTLVNNAALDWLQSPHTAGNVSPSRFSIVFLDPPFAGNLLAETLQALHASQLLTEHSWIYIETARDELLPPLPASWQIYREKVAGQVCYRLLTTSAEINC